MTTVYSIVLYRMNSDAWKVGGTGEVLCVQRLQRVCTQSWRLQIWRRRNEDDDEDDDDAESFNAQGGSEYQCGWFRVFNACNTRQFFLETPRVFEKIKEPPILGVRKQSSESNLNCQVQVFENPNQITVWFHERTAKRTPQQFSSGYI